MVRCNSQILQRFANALFSLLVLGGFACLMSATSVMAQSAVSDWVYARHGQVRLVSAQAEPDRNGELQLGLQFRLYKGWKTYWRTPGENGIAPVFDWSASTNFKTASVKWPLPQRFKDGDGHSIGYSREVILPIDVTVDDRGTETNVTLALAYAVCRDICVPAQANFRLDFPLQSEPSALNRAARDIARFEAKVPQPHEEASMQVTALTLHEQDDGQILAVSLESKGALNGAQALIEIDGPYRVGEGVPRVDEPPDHARLYFPLDSDDDAPTLLGQRLTVIAWDASGRIIEGTLPVTAGSTE